MPSSLPAAPSSAHSHLRLDGISRTFGDRRVLTDVTLTVSGGERVGLIGENGSGKTTLLRIAAGLDVPDAGSVSAPGRVGLLRQEPPFAPEETVGGAIEHAIAPVRRAVADVDAAAEGLAQQPDDPRGADVYDEALARAERLDAWSVDARIDAMLDGLGLGGIGRDRPTGALSGGQRSRLALAWLLLSAPDVLLLDEPTNHLDDAATAYLESVIRDWRGPVMIASHDRAFLDDVVTTLVDLDPSPLPHATAGPLVGDGTGTGIGVVRFTGSYTDYLEARLNARERWERQYRDEQAELKRLRASEKAEHQVGHENAAPRTEAHGAKKFYSDRNATVVRRRVNSVRTRLEDLDEAQVRKPPAELTFKGLLAGESRRRLGAPVTAAGVAVEGRLAPTSFALGAGGKLLVTGSNGAGKSTLLSVIAGDLAASAGSVQVPRAARIGLLGQDVSFPDPDESIAHLYEREVGRELAERTPLSTFGLVAGRDLNRAIGVVSTGQARRVALAIVLADPPDVLLLDEPTNHFALTLVTRLEAALPGYPGTVIVASHDRWLRRAWQGERLDLGHGGHSR